MFLISQLWCFKFVTLNPPLARPGAGGSAPRRAHRRGASYPPGAGAARPLRAVASRSEESMREGGAALRRCALGRRAITALPVGRISGGPTLSVNGRTPFKLCMVSPGPVGNPSPVRGRYVLRRTERGGAPFPRVLLGTRRDRPERPRRSRSGRARGRPLRQRTLRRPTTERSPTASEPTRGLGRATDVVAAAYPRRSDSEPARGSASDSEPARG